MEGPPRKRQKGAPGPTPWCDGRYRCILCPGGLGKGGRGYVNSRSVPCRARTSHLIPHVSEAMYQRRPTAAVPTCIHWDSNEGRAQDEYVNRRPVVAQIIRAGGDGWCKRCDPAALHVDGRFPHLLRGAPAPRNTLLTAHGGLMPKQWDDPVQTQRALASLRQRTRDKLHQVPWCDGLYRCVRCCPKGQGLPISREQCEHFDDLPRAKPGSGIVLHFDPTQAETAHESMNDNYMEIMFGMRNGCGRCVGDLDPEYPDDTDE